MRVGDEWDCADVADTETRDAMDEQLMRNDASKLTGSHVRSAAAVGSCCSAGIACECDELVVSLKCGAGCELDRTKGLERLGGDPTANKVVRLGDNEGVNWVARGAKTVRVVAKWVRPRTYVKTP